MERVDVGQALVTDEPRERILLVLSGGTWGFPGARRTEGETLEQAAVRGAREQTGLTVHTDRVAGVGEFIASLSNVHHVFVVFAARGIAGTVESQEHEEIEELRWVALEEADWLVPWYPGGVRRLVESREAVYYAHEGFE